LNVGLGTALLAQALAGVLVAWRLRLRLCAAVEVAAQYMLALAAAAIVLALGGHTFVTGQVAAGVAMDAFVVGGAMLAWLLSFLVLNWISRVLSDGGIPREQLLLGLRSELLFEGALLSLSP